MIEYFASPKPPTPEVEMKANPNLIAAIYFILAVIVMSLTYSYRITSVRADCAQEIVKAGFPAFDATKACN